MLTLEDLEPLEKLLRRHGLDGVEEEPFPNDGWSGATMTLLRRAGGDRFVLKRDSLDRDWIARSTADRPLLREAWFAAQGPELPTPIRAPYLGVARDGDDIAILMPDLSGVLFDWDAADLGRGPRSRPRRAGRLPLLPVAFVDRPGRGRAVVPLARAGDPDLSRLAGTPESRPRRRWRSHPARLGRVRPTRADRTFVT